MHDIDDFNTQLEELSIPSKIDERDDYLSLLDSIRGLEKKDQIIVALISSGFTRIEISRLVGITRNAVGKRYTKSILKLRQTMTEV